MATLATLGLRRMVEIEIALAHDGLASLTAAGHVGEMQTAEDFVRGFVIWG